MAALTIASLIAAGLQAGLGAYNSYRSGQLMNKYKDSLQSRMALNDAKIAAADTARLTPTGQAYLTAAEQQLKDQTDSLKGIAAVNGGGLDTAKANSVYNKTLGNLVSDLYSKDYATKQHRLNTLEGYGNSLYNSYLNSISQQSAQNAAAASQLYKGAVGSALGAFTEQGTTAADSGGATGYTEVGSFNPGSVNVANPTPGIEPTDAEIMSGIPGLDRKFRPSNLNKF